MFDFLRTKPPSQKEKLEVILSQHYANLEAEKGPAERTDTPPPVPRKKLRFGKRH